MKFPARDWIRGNRAADIRLEKLAVVESHLTGRRVRALEGTPRTALRRGYNMGRVTDRDLQALLDEGYDPIMGSSTPWTYMVYNSALATTAAPVAQPTGTAIRTMMQLKFATAVQARIIQWGASFDASSAATPGKVELMETGTVFATVTTAFAAADVQPWGDPNATANTAGSGGTPLNLATTASGFASAAGTEGSTTTSRMFDVGLIAPTNQYAIQFPLNREPVATVGNAVRVRATFGTTVNLVIYVIFEI